MQGRRVTALSVFGSFRRRAASTPRPRHSRKISRRERGATTDRLPRLVTSNSHSWRRWCRSRSKRCRWTAATSRRIPVARAWKKGGPQAFGNSRGGWATEMHVLGASAHTAVTSRCRRLERTMHLKAASYLRAWARRIGHASAHGSRRRNNEARQLALDLRFVPIVPPLRTRIEPWHSDRALYNDATKSSACPGRSRASSAASAGSRSSTTCSPPSSASCSSRMECGCVTDPCRQSALC